MANLCCDRNSGFGTYKLDYIRLRDTDVLSTASRQYEEFAMSRWPAFVLFMGVVVWSELPAYHDDGDQYRAPITLLAQCEFTAAVHCSPFSTPGIVSGSWVTSGGTFNSTSTTTAIATIDSYIPATVFDESLLEIAVGRFWYRARMLNQRSGSSTRVGIVYQYQDPGNFYEASFSPTGSVFVRNVSNGVSTTIATGTYSGGGQNQWFDVEVEWTAAETIVQVNGLPVVRGIRQDRLTHGRVGVTSRQATAKFDRLLVRREFGDPEFRESFSAGTPSWNVIKGSWSVVNGVYQSSAVQHGSITQLPIFLGVRRRSETRSFTVYARMLNPYRGSGNRMGFVYNYAGDSGSVSYREIVFGADGVARFNSVQSSVEPDGTTRVTVIPRETAPYPGTRNQWFDVKFTGSASDVPSLDGPDNFSISVDGTPVFTGVVDDGGLRGPIGLVTNFTPGRFDDVWFCHGGCGVEPFLASVTFDPQDPVPSWSAVRGIWDSQTGVLINSSAGASDLVYTRLAGSTNYTVSARMLNPYSASGNRIGLIFNFDFEAGDYSEVVFAPTGQAHLNHFVQGQLTHVATATHSALGRNVWFNVELVRLGRNATVKVNNQIVFENVPAARLDHIGGSIGVISHWAPGRFDDLRFERFGAPR
jgi:hypothetical protein